MKTNIKTVQEPREFWETESKGSAPKNACFNSNVHYMGTANVDNVIWTSGTFLHMYLCVLTAPSTSLTLCYAMNAHGINIHLVRGVFLLMHLKC